MTIRHTLGIVGVRWGHGFLCFGNWFAVGFRWKDSWDPTRLHLHIGNLRIMVSWGPRE